MNERPKRDAVTNREATDKLLALQKRRSSAQVQQDKESAASAAAAANGQKTTIEAQKKKRVAAFEDQLRREDQHREKTMSRPDLVSNRVCPLFFTLFFMLPKVIFAPITQSKLITKTREFPAPVKSSNQTKTNSHTESESENDSVEDRRPSFEIERQVLDSVLELSDIVQPDGLSYQPIDIPEDSVVDTESSDGHSHVYEDESDGDHEKDEDYVMDDASDKSDKSDSDMEINVEVREPMKSKGKTKVSLFFFSST